MSPVERPVGAPRIGPIESVVQRVIESGLTPAANIVATLAHHRDLSDRLAGVYQYLVFGGTTPRRDRELVILRAGWICRSEYEFGQHTLYGREAGLTDAEIAALTRPVHEYPWSPADAGLLTMADELMTTWTLTDDTWAAVAS